MASIAPQQQARSPWARPQRKVPVEDFIGLVDGAEENSVGHLSQKCKDLICPRDCRRMICMSQQQRISQAESMKKRLIRG